jgi:DNA-binding HxlR family transcriptional regulator
MSKWGGYARFCSLSRGLDLVGERWTLVIIQELLHAPHRYGELRRLLPGIGSNVLSDRLKRLEAGGLVERVPGSVGEGVQYALTDRGSALGPALALFRQWGLAELLPSPENAGAKRDASYDLSYAVPEDLDLHEAYVWRIDDDAYALEIDGAQLHVRIGVTSRPAVVVTTTREFMQRWVAGATNWDDGRRSGEVDVVGSDDAWDRMLLATGYPGRPKDLVSRLRELQRARPAPAAPPRSPPRTALNNP